MKLTHKQIDGARVVVGSVALDAVDCIYADNTGGAPLTVTLPSIIGVGDTATIYVAPGTSPANAITVDATPNLVDGASSYVIDSGDVVKVDFVAVSATEWVSRPTINAVGSGPIVDITTTTTVPNLAAGQNHAEYAVKHTAPITITLPLLASAGQSLRFYRYASAVTNTVSFAGPHTVLPSSLTGDEVGLWLAVWSSVTSDWQITQIAADVDASGSVTISDTAPLTPTAGDLWFDATNQIMFLYYTDGTNFAWVDVSGTAAAGGTSVAVLNDLLDVNVTSPTPGDGLIYDGTEWITFGLTSSFLQISGGTLAGSGTNLIALDPTNGRVEAYNPGSGSLGTRIEPGVIRLLDSGGFPSDPVDPSHVTTKKYVDDAIAAVGGATGGTNEHFLGQHSAILNISGTQTISFGFSQVTNSLLNMGQIMPVPGRVAGFTNDTGQNVTLRVSANIHVMFSGTPNSFFGAYWRVFDASLIARPYVTGLDGTSNAVSGNAYLFNSSGTVHLAPNERVEFKITMNDVPSADVLAPTSLLTTMMVEKVWQG